jgi:hypothetical protein
MKMNDSQKLDEILYLLRLQEWKAKEPYLTPMCGMAHDSELVQIENERWKRWAENKPRRNVWYGEGGLCND